jgi:hypothetical protein
VPVRLLLAAALTLIACATAPTPAATEHVEEQPIDRWEKRSEHVFVAADDCSEGPLEVELPALETTYARRAVLLVYSPRALPLHATLRVDGRELHTLGWSQREPERAPADAAQSRCRVARHEAVEAPGPATHAPKTTHAPAVKTRHAEPTKVAAPPPPPKIRELPELPSKRPGSGIEYAFAFWAGHQTPKRSVEIATTSWSGGMKGAIELELWGDDMLDLRDVVFVVREDELVPLIPIAEYTQALELQVDAARAHNEACREKPDTVGCGIHTSLEKMASRPPPPPRDEVRPKPPSPDALWVSGSWRWNGTDYLWTDGTWRVPEPAPAVVAVAAKPVPPPAPACARATSSGRGHASSAACTCARSTAARTCGDSRVTSAAR